MTKTLPRFDILLEKWLSYEVTFNTRYTLTLHRDTVRKQWKFLWHYLQIKYFHQQEMLDITNAHTRLTSDHVNPETTVKSHNIFNSLIYIFILRWSILVHSRNNT